MSSKNEKTTVEVVRTITATTSAEALATANALTAVLPPEMEISLHRVYGEGYWNDKVYASKKGGEITVDTLPAALDALSWSPFNLRPSTIALNIGVGGRMYDGPTLRSFWDKIQNLPDGKTTIRVYGHGPETPAEITEILKSIQEEV